jgi:hypothetical protein
MNLLAPKVVAQECPKIKQHQGRHLGEDYEVDLCVYRDIPSP